MRWYHNPHLKPLPYPTSNSTSIPIHLQRPPQTPPRPKSTHVRTDYRQYNRNPHPSPHKTYTPPPDTSSPSPSTFPPTSSTTQDTGCYRRSSRRYIPRARGRGGGSRMRSRSRSRWHVGLWYCRCGFSQRSSRRRCRSGNRDGILSRYEPRLRRELTNSFEPTRLDIPSLETGDLHSMQPTRTQEPWVWRWSVVWRVMHSLHTLGPWPQSNWASALGKRRLWGG